MTEHRLSGLIELLSARRLLTAPPLLAGVLADVDPRIGAVRYDSRQVRAGDLFVARPGQHSDGHDHLPAAVAAGAVAVIVERPALRLGLPQLVTPDARIALGIAAAWAAGEPSQALGIVGITGTDGKTTTAYLVRTILEAAGEPTGLVGTTDVIAGGVGSGNPARTSTPEAPELQTALAAMRAAGDRWAVLESSSHGLAQQRVRGVAYDVAVLTNITSEHLEFHGTLEAYRAAKRSLFSRLAVSAENPEKGWGKHAVVNADDPTAESMAAAAVAAGARVWRYGFSGELGTRGARRARHDREQPAGDPGRDARAAPRRRMVRPLRPATGGTLQRGQRARGPGRGASAGTRPRHRRFRPGAPGIGTGSDAARR